MANNFSNIFQRFTRKSDLCNRIDDDLRVAVATKFDAISHRDWCFVRPSRVMFLSAVGGFTGRPLQIGRASCRERV